MPRAFYVTNTPHSLQFLNSIYQPLVRLYCGKETILWKSTSRRFWVSGTTLSNRSAQCMHRRNYETRGTRIAVLWPTFRAVKCLREWMSSILERDDSK